MNWDEATPALSDATANETDKAILEQTTRHNKAKPNKTKHSIMQIKKLLKQLEKQTRVSGHGETG